MPNNNNGTKVLFVGGPADGKRIWIEYDRWTWEVPELPKCAVVSSVDEISEIVSFIRWLYTRRMYKSGEKYFFTFAPKDWSDEQVFSTLLSGYTKQENKEDL